MNAFFPDFHVHSRRSADSQTAMSEHCRRALEIGVTHLAFADHLETDPRHDFYGRYDYDAARAEFEETRREFGRKIELFFGVEVTCHASICGQIRDALKGKEYDFVMGSVHHLEKFGEDVSSDAGASQIFVKNDPVLVYENYLEEVEASIKSGLFDVIGHIGIVRRHGLPFLAGADFARFEPVFGRIARAVVESGVTVEMNASGFNHPPNETYPDEDFLRTLARMNFKNVTVGSDAHKPAELGAHVRDALDIIRRCGLDEIVFFRRRKMRRCRIS